MLPGNEAKLDTFEVGSKGLGNPKENRQSRKSHLTYTDPSQEK